MKSDFAGVIQTVTFPEIFDHVFRVLRYQSNRASNFGDLSVDDFDTTTYYDDVFYDDVDTEETQDRLAAVAAPEHLRSVSRKWCLPYLSTIHSQSMMPSSWFSITDGLTGRSWHSGICAKKNCSYI